MKYNIVPSNYDIETREAESITDALVGFATDMDSDMGRYFKAIPAVKQSSEMVDDICRLIRTSELSASDISAIFRALQSQDNYIGGKIWTTDDIKSQISDNYPEGLVLSDDAISNIANDADLEEALSDCQDQEWEAIDDAIRDSDIKIHISDIDWDVNADDFDDEAEYDAVNENLPKEVEIPLSELEGNVEIEDYLSDNYDYCVKSFKTEEVAA